MDHTDLNLSYAGGIRVDDPGHQNIFPFENNLMPDIYDNEDDFNYFSDINDFFFEDQSSLHNCVIENDLVKEQDSPQAPFLKNASTPISNQAINQQTSIHSLIGSKYQNNNIKSETSVEDLPSGGSNRSPKRKVGLSRQANDFKKLYYQIFTSKKRFPKEIVKKIHNIMLIPLQLKKMSRDEYRMIDLYFQEYTKYSTQILIYLQKHKQHFLDVIPELSNLK